jgi:chromosome partitioning protein
MHIWPIVNRKGGVTKTTSTINIAAELAHTWHLRVASVDLDSQATLSTLATAAGQDEPDPDRTVLAALLPEHYGHSDVTGLLRPAPWGGVILPGHADLVGADDQLKQAPGPHQRLKHALAPLAGEVDVVLIDCPAATGKLTFNALCAATGTFIPVSASYPSVAGLRRLFQTIDLIRHYEHPDLTILGIFATFTRPTRHARDTLLGLQRQVGEQLMSTSIPVNVTVEDAHLDGLAARDLDAASTGARAYAQLAREMLQLANGLPNARRATTAELA